MKFQERRTTVADLLKVALLATIAVGATPSAQAANMTQQKPCAGLEGNARTKCLRAEVERGQRESEAASRKVKRLDRALKVACGADRAAPYAANAAAKGGGAAYNAGRLVGDKLTGKKPCG